MVSTSATSRKGPVLRATRRRKEAGLVLAAGAVAMAARGCCTVNTRTSPRLLADGPSQQQHPAFWQADSCRRTRRGRHAGQARHSAPRVGGRACPGGAQRSAATYKARQAAPGIGGCRGARWAGGWGREARPAAASARVGQAPSGPGAVRLTGRATEQPGRPAGRGGPWGVMAASGTASGGPATLFSSVLFSRLLRPRQGHGGTRHVGPRDDLLGGGGGDLLRVLGRLRLEQGESLSRKGARRRPDGRDVRPEPWIRTPGPLPGYPGRLVAPYARRRGAAVPAPPSRTWRICRRAGRQPVPHLPGRHSATLGTLSGRGRLSRRPSVLGSVGRGRPDGTEPTLPEEGGLE